MIYVSDADKVTVNENNEQGLVTSIINISNKNYHMAYFEVFGWYWTFQYINAIVICTIGCAVGIYYFTPLIKGNRVLYNII